MCNTLANNNTLTNTGSSSIPAITTQLSFFTLRGTTKFTTTETDNLLIALAASIATKTGAATAISVSGTRTTASDAAVTTLTSKTIPFL
jgi:hypothetical protein